MMQTAPKICLVYSQRSALSETFCQNHEVELAKWYKVHVLWGGHLPEFAGDGTRLDVNPGVVGRIRRSLLRRCAGVEVDYFAKMAIKQYLQCNDIDLVIAEFAYVGANLYGICCELKIPLIVYFRGADGSNRSCLNQYGETYKPMSDYASAIVTVSSSLKNSITPAYAPPEKVDVIPSGTDMRFFHPNWCDTDQINFVYVGRFVEKKAPFLVLLAFQLARGQRPDATLTMVGEGELLGTCKHMAKALGIDESVTFAGALPRELVRSALQSSRCLLHHAVVAMDGDMEGTPNVVVEAGACGLPVVATRHGGIPEVVVHGKTGFLVQEYDIRQMAEYLVMLANDSKLSRSMGRAARARVEQLYALDQSIQQLRSLIDSILGS